MQLLKKSVFVSIMFIVSLLQAGCLGMPDGARVVTGFELDRYLGTWYEIARLDHRFERGLSNVTASYSLREDGGVHVLNRGFKVAKQEWETAEGKAYFVGNPDIGSLKVSFFGPFYGAYNVVELDQENYQYAMVVGPNTNYLWILARSPDLDPGIIAGMIENAKRLGFAVDELIFVDHDKAQ